MKHLRIILICALTGGILLFAYLSRSNNQEFESPTECVNAFYQSALRKDESKMQRCIATELHADVATFIRAKSDLKGFARCSVEKSKDDAVVEMDEIRKADTHRVRIHLKKQPSGWQIVSIGSPQRIETDVKPGTSLNDVPDP